MLIFSRWDISHVLVQRAPQSRYCNAIESDHKENEEEKKVDHELLQRIPTPSWLAMRIHQLDKMKQRVSWGFSIRGMRK